MQEQQAVPYTLDDNGHKIICRIHGEKMSVTVRDALPCLGGHDEGAADRACNAERDALALFAASANSYARLGPDAVRLAEADLLGQAVEALRPFAKMADQYDVGGGNRPYTDEDTIIGINYTGEMFDLKVKHLRAARAILAQLPESRP